MADVQFGSGATLITISHEEIESVRVTITEPDLSARRVVYGAYSDGFAGLATFFAGLADRGGLGLAGRALQPA
jgi:hypothetical protein